MSAESITFDGFYGVPANNMPWIPNPTNKTQTRVNLDSQEQSAFLSKMSTNIVSESFQTVLLNELEEMYKIGQHDGWLQIDDIDVKAISETSYVQAKCFVLLLEDEISLPTIIPDEDGFIGFQWQMDDKIASIYFIQNDKFMYIRVDNLNNEQESGILDYQPLEMKNFINKIKQMGF